MTAPKSGIHSRTLGSYLEDKSNQIRYVRVTWVDLINFVRYRVLPVERVEGFLVCEQEYNPALSLEDGRDVYVNPRKGISLTKASLGLVFIALAEGFGPTGELHYVPDESSTFSLAHADGQLSIMGFFEEKECDRHIVELNRSSSLEIEKAFRSPLCPRNLLLRIVGEAAKQGVTFLVGFESEVIFLSSVTPIQAVNDYSWSVSQALPAGSVETRAVEEIADILNRQGLLEMYHSEAAPGQYEFVTVPGRPLEAVDALIFTRETIRNVASKHGLHATFAPRLYTDTCGSAAHVHISVASTKPHHLLPSSSPIPLNNLNASFLQGLLTHLPAACAFTLPTPASYARAVDGAWSGGTYVAWGRDNRETPVRLCGRGAADPNLNWEVKCLDGTANPYLALGALLAAGLDGVKSRAELEVGTCQVAPAEMSSAERETKGVKSRMPLSLEEARTALRGDVVLRKAMGDELVNTYLAVNKTLSEQLEADTPEEAMIKLVKTY